MGLILHPFSHLSNPYSSKKIHCLPAREKNNLFEQDLQDLDRTDTDLQYGICVLKTCGRLVKLYDQDKSPFA